MRHQNFIDRDKLYSLLDNNVPTESELNDILNKARKLKGLNLNDERDDGDVPVVERKPLPTKNNVGKSRNYGVDLSGLSAVGNEYCNCSYSLLHQVLGFWVRRIIVS